MLIFIIFFAIISWKVIWCEKQIEKKHLSVSHFLESLEAWRKSDDWKMCHSPPSGFQEWVLGVHSEFTNECREQTKPIHHPMVHGAPESKLQFFRLPLVEARIVNCTCFNIFFFPQLQLPLSCTKHTVELAIHVSQKKNNNLLLSLKKKFFKSFLVHKRQQQPGNKGCHMIYPHCWGVLRETKMLDTTRTVPEKLGHSC